jgi:glycosyltransferase involved in cell wall biosynthesis
MKTKVAIFQNTITGGGRIRVLNEIIRALNELKVKPDIYAYKINTAISGNMNIRKCFPVVYGLYELKVLSLNLRMRFIAPKYDLCINSNNTILFAPANDAISYIHFPREARILSVYEKTGAQKSSPTAYERLLTSLFRYRRYNENNKIIANSSYTKSIIERVYPEIRPSDISVLYPPIYPKEGSPDRKKRDVVCTLGRFSWDKRQLEQIQIAERLPDLQFEIMGFVGDRNGRIYFNKCQNYVRDNKVTNVTLFPSLAYEEVDDKLSTAKFFMHNLRNEPFGISTVEAITSGCVPVVHDSGGQREIVPIGALRFSNAAAAIDILKDTDRLDTGEIQTILRENIKRFEVNRFREQIFSILEEKLN